MLLNIVEIRLGVFLQKNKYGTFLRKNIVWYFAKRYISLRASTKKICYFYLNLLENSLFRIFNEILNINSKNKAYKMERIIKVHIYKFAFISTFAALIFMVIGIKINLNLISFLILLLYFAFEYFIFQKFWAQINVSHSKEIKNIKKKYQKGIKVENLEEISRKKTEEIAQLKANEQFRKEFIGNVAHELKTPIFNVQGFISTLLDGAINDPSVNLKYLERSDKNIQRLISLVKDLDTISKLETGKIIPDFQNFDLKWRF